jgi:hypothetical protein
VPGAAPNMSTRPPGGVLSGTIHRWRSHSARDTMHARLSDFCVSGSRPIRKEAAIRCTAGRSSTGHPQSRNARRQGDVGPPSWPAVSTCCHPGCNGGLRLRPWTSRSKTATRRLIFAATTCLTVIPHRGSRRRHRFPTTHPVWRREEDESVTQVASMAGDT